MPFLNLKKSSARVEHTEHARYQTELKVQLSAEDLQAILVRLNDLRAAEGSELRVDFPQGWTLFWKLRSGETRFLLAHPEAELWVGTLAFEAEHLQQVIGGWPAEGPVSFSKVVPIARMSNLEVTFSPL